MVFVNIKGKDLLSGEITKLLGKETSIGSLYIAPPFSLVIKDLAIEDFLTVEKMQIEPSIIGLFAGKLGLNKLLVYSPQVSIVRTGETEFNVNEIVDRIKLLQDDSKGSVNFFIKEALIEDGRLSFKDNVARFSFDIMPIDASVITTLPDLKTRINLEAKVVSSKKEKIGEASLSGWLNILKKDMDAKLSAEADLVSFSPYFSQFVSNMQSGKLLFNADLNSIRNDLTVDCHLETSDLVFRDSQGSQEGSSGKVLFEDVAGLVFNNLTGTGKGGVFDFSIHTKFDNPKLEGLKIKGNIFKSIVENVIQKGIVESVLQGGQAGDIEKVGDDFKAIGDNIKEQFEDIGDKLKDQILGDILGSGSQGSDSQESSGDTSNQQ
jgi:hypothetical protein